MKKKNYLPPRIEVIEVENEGVMALSDFGSGDHGSLPGNSTQRSSNHNPSSALSDLEDLINDLLTY